MDKKYPVGKSQHLTFEFAILLFKKLIITLGISILLHTTANAAALPVIDSYANAMGQAEAVVSGRFGVLQNPAVIPLNVSSKDIFTSAVYGQTFQRTQHISDIQKQMLPLLAGLPTTPANSNAISALIRDVDGTTDHYTQYGASAMGLPNLPLGIVGFISANHLSQLHVYSNGSPDYTNPASPDLHSTVAYKAVSLFQIGGQFSHVLSKESGDSNRLVVGITPKLQAIKTYYYAEPFATANLASQTKQTNNNSLFNLDLGLIKEFRYTYKAGIYLKNVFAQQTHFGKSDEYFTIEPEVKTGASYRGNRFLITTDVDMNVTQPFGFEKHHRHIRAGAEYYMLDYFRVSGGFNQNVIGNQETSISVGAGLDFTYLDIQAVLVKEEDHKLMSISAQIRF